MSNCLALLSELTRAWWDYKTNPTGPRAHKANLAMRDVILHGGEFLQSPTWAALNFPHTGFVCDETLSDRKADLADTDRNSADCVVEIQISGNKLVSILNRLDFLEANCAPEYKRSAHNSIRAYVETLRDILAEQRAEKRG